MVDVLERITRQRLTRGWSEYQLAERSGVPQSTISSWYSKGARPSLASLEKICRTFGITMAQLFAEEAERIDLTKEQRKMLEKWNALSDKQKQALFELLDSWNEK